MSWPTFSSSVCFKFDTCDRAQLCTSSIGLVFLRISAAQLLFCLQKPLHRIESNRPALGTLCSQALHCNRAMRQGLLPPTSTRQPAALGAFIGTLPATPCCVQCLHAHVSVSLLCAFELGSSLWSEHKRCFPLLISKFMCVGWRITGWATSSSVMLTIRTLCSMSPSFSIRNWVCVFSPIISVIVFIVGLGGSLAPGAQCVSFP